MQVSANHSSLSTDIKTCLLGGQAQGSIAAFFVNLSLGDTGGGDVSLLHVTAAKFYLRLLHLQWQLWIHVCRVK